MDRPQVSIILPSLRQEQLRRCTESIRCCSGGVSYEIIVIAPFAVEAEPDVIYVPEEKREGIYRAVARGYAICRGDYLVHIPDDVRATPGWLSNMLAFMKQHEGEVFEGNFRHFDVRGERAEPGYYGRLFAPFICIRKDTAEQIGGLMDCYYNSFFGDADLSLRVWHAGGRVKTCPGAWIYHADYADEVHEVSSGDFFIKDRDAFVTRWHEEFARKGDRKDFVASTPVSSRFVSDELPPERCTRLLLGLKQHDPGVIDNAMNEDDAALCVYEEGFPVLYNAAKEALQARKKGYSEAARIITWLEARGYTPPAGGGRPAPASRELRFTKRVFSGTARKIRAISHRK